MIDELPDAESLADGWRASQRDRDRDAFEDQVAREARPPRPGVTIKDGVTEIVSDLKTFSESPDELLRQHGMDPAEWEILEAKVGRWDAAAKNRRTEEWIRTDLHLVRVRVRPKKAPLWLVPASGTSRIA